MIAFSTLIYSLAKSDSTSTRVELFKDYFHGNSSDEDKLWTIAIFTDRRPPSTIKTSLLKLWAAEVAGIPLWLFEDSYRIVGDLAESLALVLPLHPLEADLSLSHCMDTIIHLKNKDVHTQKEIITSIWNQLDIPQRWTFNKLLIGSFRISVYKRDLVQALSDVYSIPSATITHLLHQEWNPKSTMLQKLLLVDSSITNSSQPYPFIIPSPIEKTSIVNLAPNDWSAEWKWDGIRVQVIKRKDNVYIWDTNEGLVTKLYPECKQILNITPLSVVLDCMLMVWKDDKPLALSHWKHRKSNNNPNKSTLADYPIICLCHDILEYNEQDIRHCTYLERRVVLHQLLKEMNNPSFLYCQNLEYKNWEELNLLHQQSRQNHADGIILKNNQSTYLHPQKEGDWYTWKAEVYTINAVLMYAQKGIKNQSNQYIEFTFGLWDNDDLIPIAKTNIGLSDDNFLQLSSWIKSNTLESFGPVARVSPIHIFRIAFTNISHSSRHKSGIIVKSPIIEEWLKNASPNQANKLSEIKELINIY